MHCDPRRKANYGSGFWLALLVLVILRMNTRTHGICASIWPVYEAFAAAFEASSTLYGATLLRLLALAEPKGRRVSG
jgi:hypothetical protein